MAEIDQTKSKKENVEHNASKLADKMGDVAMNLPSNEEVLHNLNKVKVELDKAKTAPEIDNTGRRILQDAELIAEDLKIFVKERNEGDRMQELAREAKLAADMFAAHSKEVSAVSKSGAKNVNMDGINNAAKDGFKSVQSAVTEIVRSSEFRQELLDFLRFAADIFRTGIKDSRKEHVSSKSEKKLNRLDRDEQVVPEQVTNVKHQAEHKVNQQLDKLNMPHRVELNDEQMDELVTRFLDIMRSITQRPRTREAFLGIMNLVQLITWELNQNSGHLRAQTKHSANVVRDDDHVRRMIMLAREEIEQFTGGRSVKPFFRHYKAIVRAIREDDETRKYFSDLFHFIDNMIQHPESIDAERTRGDVKALIQRSRSLKNREVSDHLSDSFREARRIIKRVTQDPVLQRMRTDFGRLIDDITKDSYGKFTMDGNVWNQLRLILTYSVIERVRIPLPPIENEDEKRQYRVKDVVLNLRDFVPQSVTLEDHARIQFDVNDIRHPKIRKTRNVFSLNLKNIHFAVHDVDVWFRRKRAPHMETALKADIEIGPEGRDGLDLDIDLVSKPGQPGMFKVRSVRATISNIMIHVADTSMAFMYNTVLKVIKGRIAARLERAIEDGLRDGLEKLNKVMVERIGDPARKAAHSAGDKAGEMDMQDLFNRFRETALGQQTERALHMAKGDSAKGKRDRKKVKKNAHNVVVVGKQKAREVTDKASDRVAEHNADKYYGSDKHSSSSHHKDSHGSHKEHHSSDSHKEHHKDSHDSHKEHHKDTHSDSHKHHGGDHLPISTSGHTVQKTEYVASYTDGNHHRYEQAEKTYMTQQPDGSLVETRIHQDKVSPSSHPL